MKLSAILIAGGSLCFSLNLFAQVDVPELSIYNYTASARDPFISSEAPTTFLGKTQELRGLVSGDIVEQYLAKIRELIKDELYVGGVSIGDSPQESMALINGSGLHVGDKIPLEANQGDLQAIRNLAGTYGLPVPANEKGELLIEVGRITESGVELVLPGFRAPIYQLPLPRDTAQTGIRLVKKPKQRTTN